MLNGGIVVITNDHFIFLAHLYRHKVIMLYWCDPFNFERVFFSIPFCLLFSLIANNFHTNHFEAFRFPYMAVVLANGSKKCNKLQRNVFYTNMEMEWLSNSGLLLKTISDI